MSIHKKRFLYRSSGWKSSRSSECSHFGGSAAGEFLQHHLYQNIAAAASIFSIHIIFLFPLSLPSLSLSSFHFLWDTSNAATRLHTLYMMMSLPPPQPPSKHLHRNILLIPYPAPLPGFQLNTRKKATEFFFACDLFHGQNNTTRKSQGCS